MSNDTDLLFATIDDIDRRMSRRSLSRAIGKQIGYCDICAKFGKLVIDHDHVTGKVRGMLCRECNLALGLFEDNTDRMRDAISYLSSR